MFIGIGTIIVIVIIVLVVMMLRRHWARPQPPRSERERPATSQTTPQPADLASGFWRSCHCRTYGSTWRSGKCDPENYQAPADLHMAVRSDKATGQAALVPRQACDWSRWAARTR